MSHIKLRHWPAAGIDIWSMLWRHDEEALDVHIPVNMQAVFKAA